MGGQLMQNLIYDSEKNDKSEFIKQMQNLTGEMLICVYKNHELVSIDSSFAETYSVLENELEHIVATRHGDDIMIDNFLIRRTTELGKSIFISWWHGCSYELSVFNSFEFDSPLLEPLYYPWEAKIL